jgi:hypothetical protein
VNQGPIWGRLLKKTRGRQSRATVPVRLLNVFKIKLTPLCLKQFPCDKYTGSHDFLVFEKIGESIINIINFTNIVLNTERCLGMSILTRRGYLMGEKM